MPDSRKRRRINQGIRVAALPMHKQWGMESGEEPGAGPWRGLRLKQRQELTLLGLCRTLPQGFQSQEEGKLLPEFMEYQKEPVEQLVGNACFFPCPQDGPLRLHAHGYEGKECLNGIGGERDYVHGQEGMGHPAGRAFQAQDFHARLL